MRSRAASLSASAIFLIVAPGTVAGYLPWAIGRWHHLRELPASGALGWVGIGLIVAGALALLECFARFALVGIGTPAPIAPTRRLVVSGLYRHVRNPMYVAVFALTLGQALYFSQIALLVYAAAVWGTFHLFVLGYEEPTLRRQFPADYQAFFAAVPRWIPRLSPWRRA